MEGSYFPKNRGVVKSNRQLIPIGDRNEKTERFPVRLFSIAAVLERNVVVRVRVVEVVRGMVRGFRRGGAGGGGRGRTAFGTAIAATGGGRRAAAATLPLALRAAEELDALGADAEAALLLAFLGLPLVELEASVDEDRGPLLEELLAGLGLTAPRDDVDVANLVLGLPVLRLVGAVDRDGEVADGGPLRV